MIMPKNTLTIVLLSTATAVWLVGSHCIRAIEPMQIEYCWQSDPKLDARWWDRIERLKWKVTGQHVQSPRAEVRMQAAQAIIKDPEGSSSNRPELAKALIDRLKQGESGHTLRADFVAALCELDDAGDHAETLWKLCENDEVTRPTVERALAKWAKPIALSTWKARLVDKRCTEQDLSMACMGLGIVGGQDDLGLLTAVVTDATASNSVRLVAAKAIGRLSQTEQIKLAEQLKSSPALHGDLLAMVVLGKNVSPETKKFVADIAQNASLLAQREAYRWLCEFDPETARSLAMAFTNRDDSEIRKLCITIINQTENADAVPLMFKMLGDVHPDVRRLAHEQLLVNCGRSSEHEKAIRALTAPGLANADWQTKEQSILLTVELKQSEHIARLLELLNDPRPEVNIAAAWALRHLATEEQTLHAMLQHVQFWTGELKRQTSDYQVEEFHRRRMAHLLDSFGVRMFEPAKETLLQFVPRNEILGLMPRVSAIWSCGKLWKGKRNPQLTNELVRRIADKNNLFPEAETVRFTSTIALGWIADPATREALVTYDEPLPNPIGCATQFALECIDNAAQQK